MQPSGEGRRTGRARPLQQTSLPPGRPPSESLYSSHQTGGQPLFSQHQRSIPSNQSVQHASGSTWSRPGSSYQTLAPYAGGTWSGHNADWQTQAEGQSYAPMAESSAAGYAQSIQRVREDQTSAQSSTDSLSSATEYSQPPQQQQQQQQPYSVQMTSTDAVEMARDEEKDRRERRKEQNRIAQQELRKRRYEHTIALEQQVASLTAQLEHDRAHTMMIEEALRKAQAEVQSLRQALTDSQSAVSTSNTLSLETSNTANIPIPMYSWPTQSYAYKEQPGYESSLPILPSPPGTASNDPLAPPSDQAAHRRRRGSHMRPMTARTQQEFHAYPGPPTSSTRRRLSAPSSNVDVLQEVEEPMNPSQYSSQPLSATSSDFPMRPNPPEFAFAGTLQGSSFTAPPTGYQGSQHWQMELTPTPSHAYEQSQPSHPDATQSGGDESR